MDILENKYYRLNKNLLVAIGQWPYQDSCSSRKYLTLTIFGLVSLLVPQLIKLYESLDDVDLIIECLTPILTNIACLIKFFNYFINNEKMRGLLDHMRRDWESAKFQTDLDILDEYAENGRKMSKIYTIYIFSSATLFCLAPLSPQLLNIVVSPNESRPWKPIYEIEYFVDEKTYIFPILLHSIVVTYAAMLVLVATDSMYMSYVEHACGIFVAVKLRVFRFPVIPIITHSIKLFAGIDWSTWVTLENREFIPLPITALTRQNQPVHTIRTIAVFHGTRFAELVESAYTVYFFMLLALTVLLISLSGLHTVMKMDEPETFVRFGVLTVGQMIHVFFNSLPGQRLIEHSTAISNSVAMAEWYRLSIRAKRLLIIVIMRSDKPSSISAGKLCVMCLESFCKIVQSSMSYFTVLSSVR